jgi:hypothetical protein
VLRRAGRALSSQALRRRIARTVGALNTNVERRPPVPPRLRERLSAEFAPEMTALGELLGRDLSGWCAAR